MKEMVTKYQVPILVFLGLSVLALWSLRVIKPVLAYSEVERLLPVTINPHVQSPMLSEDIKHVQIAVIGARLSLYCRLVEKRKCNHVVVFTHGHGNRAESYLHLLESLPEDVSVVVWDWRGMGESTGAPTDTNCCHDLSAVIAWTAHTTDVPIHSVCLWGFSLGGNIVLRHIRDMGAENSAQRLIVHSPFVRLNEVMKHHGWKRLHLLGYIMGNMDVSGVLAEFNGQALVMGSDDDPIVPFEHCRELAEEADHVVLCQLPSGTGHVCEPSGVLLDAVYSFLEGGRSPEALSTASTPVEGVPHHPGSPSSSTESSSGLDTGARVVQ